MTNNGVLARLGIDILRRKRKDKPRKTFKRSFDSWKLQEEGNSKLQTQPEVEDFFSLLQSPSTSPRSSVCHSLKENTGTSSQCSKSSKEIINNFTLESTSNNKTLNGSKKVPRKIILPGTMIKLENSELFLKSAEDNPNEIESVLSSVSEEVKESTENPPATETTEITLSNEKLKFKGSEKQKCESDSGKKCICSVVSVKTNLNDIFIHSKTQTQALEAVKAFRCKEFSPVPNRFEINSHTTPKTIDKEKKPITVNQETGPKEIDKSTLSDFINQIKSASVEGK